jgi:hypothetical protein
MDFKESLAAVTELDIKDWIRFFRNESSTRWRIELWPSEGTANVSRLVLRRIGTTLVNKLKFVGISDQFGDRRMVVANQLTWLAFNTSPPPEFAEWLEHYKAWRSINPTVSEKYSQAFLALVRWLQEVFGPDDYKNVRSFMSSSRRNKMSFVDFMFRRVDLETGRGGRTTLDQLYAIQRFTEVLETKLAPEDSGARWYPLITKASIDHFKNVVELNGGNGRPTEAKAKALPPRLYRLAKQTLEEGEAGWPGSCGLCAIEVPNESGGVEKIYCPVLPNLVLTTFHLPLRAVQARRFDSGEGDTQRYLAGSNEWVDNTGPLAGYWAKENMPPQRGYAARISTNEGSTIAGFFINTNKTGAPYIIPWQSQTLHALFESTRAWVEKYVPLDRPIEPKLYVDKSELAEAGKLQDYPHIFPLFRLPMQGHLKRHGCPPTAGQLGKFWYALLAEIERRWNVANPSDQISIVIRQKNTGQPVSSIYGLHGQRVAKITELLQRGVPLEIVSKLVAGHKSILMTLYYMKYDPQTIHDVIKRAAQAPFPVGKINSEVPIGEALEVGGGKCVFLSNENLKASNSLRKFDPLWKSDLGFGICPWAGTRCHDGGREVRTGVFAPVEGGARNCILCRHFVTGLPWALGLSMYGSKLCRELQIAEQKVSLLVAKMSELLEAVESSSAEREAMTSSLERIELEIEIIKAEQETIAKGICRVVEVLEAVHLTEKGEADSALIVRQQHSLIEYLEVPELEQTIVLTASSRAFPILDSKETEARRNHFLDQIMYNSGHRPITLAPLSPELKKRSLDALSRLLLENVSRAELAAMQDNVLRLKDVGLDDNMKSALTEIVGPEIKLLERAA